MHILAFPSGEDAAPSLFLTVYCSLSFAQKLTYFGYMLGDTSTHNWILAKYVCPVSPKTSILILKRSKPITVLFLFFYVAFRRVSISALHNAHRVVVLSRGDDKPNSSALIQHNLPWCVFFISISRILKRKEMEMCVSCGFVTSNTPHYVISSYACF